MIAIKREIDRVAAGDWPAEDNPLRNTPHTAESIAGKWDHPYSREEAAYPMGAADPGRSRPTNSREDGPVFPFS